MKTLFEEARRDNPELDGAEIIYIQNVADYLYSLKEEFFDVVSDFPNLAPPFPLFWMEYRLSDVLYDGEQMRENDSLPSAKFGFLFESREIEEGWITKISLITRFSKVYEMELRAYLYWVVKIDKQGKPITDFTIHMPDGSINLNEPMEGHFYTWLTPALLSISFLHCKNVHMIEHEPKRATSGRISRHGSKIRFHTLQIEPMKKILRDEGGAEETGIKHALHICRGHFKDFTKGKGLFGKYKEVYWWESQVRGSGDVGAVLKNYNVNKPDNGN